MNCEWLNLPSSVLMSLTVFIVEGVASLGRRSKSRAEYAGESNEKHFGGDHFGLLIVVAWGMRIYKYDQVFKTPDILLCCC